MPQIGALSWVLWGFVAALQAAFAIAVARRGSWRRWPSLAAFIWSRSLLTFLLMGIAVGMPDTDERAARYFYLFWIGTAISLAFQVWIVVQIGMAFLSATSFLKRPVRDGILGCLLLATVIAAALSFQAPMSPSGRIVTFVIDLSKAVNLAWLLAFLAIIGTTEFLGLTWKPAVLSVAIGFAILAAGQTAVAWLLSLYSSHWTHISDLQSVLYLASLLVWTGALRAPAIEKNQLTSPQDLASWIRAYTSTIERLRKKPWVQ